MVAKITAEIGINHQGNLDVAMMMVEALKPSGVDYVKFQKLSPREFLSKSEYDKPHPNPANSFGNTYGEHKEAMELSAMDHIKLKEHIEAHGMQYACSVFDIDSAKQIIPIGPAFIKIPSCCANRFDLIKYVDKNFDGGLHISLGMTTQRERARVRGWMKGARNEVILYSTTSDYTGSEVYYEKEYPGASIHVPRISLGIKAAERGASWLEYHYTYSREAKGTDHVISLLPAEFRILVREVNDSPPLIGKRPEGWTKGEEQFRKKLWRGLAN